jgi:hypothetical protein
MEIRLILVLALITASFSQGEFMASVSKPSLKEIVEKIAAAASEHFIVQPLADSRYRVLFSSPELKHLSVEVRSERKESSNFNIHLMFFRAGHFIRDVSMSLDLVQLSSERVRQALQLAAVEVSAIVRHERVASANEPGLMKVLWRLFGIAEAHASSPDIVVKALVLGAAILGTATSFYLNYVASNFLDGLGAWFNMLTRNNPGETSCSQRLMSYAPAIVFSTLLWGIAAYEYFAG